LKGRPIVTRWFALPIAIGYCCAVRVCRLRLGPARRETVVRERPNRPAVLFTKEPHIKPYSRYARATHRPPHESLRSMTPDSDSPLFWRVRVMTQAKLESQSHDSGRAGESAVFMGVMTLSYRQSLLLSETVALGDEIQHPAGPTTSPTPSVRRSGALAEGAPRLPQIGKPYRRGPAQGGVRSLTCTRRLFLSSPAPPRRLPAGPR
jgi:hypothetical protein